MTRIRVIPVFVFVAFLALTVKILDTMVHTPVFGTISLPSSLYLSPATASAQGEELEEAEKEPTEGDESAMEEMEGTPAQRIMTRKEAEAELAPDQISPNAELPERIRPTQQSAMEKKLLENLAERQKELKAWEESITMKENILNAAEKKVNRKIEELKALKEEVDALLNQYNEKENQKILKLVKIYQSMKPKDAAGIFNEMNITILLEVMDKMSERKAAPILASMDVIKAREVTVRLAERRRLSSD